MKIQVNCSIKSLLCDQLGVTPDFVDKRIQTIFLDGKAVDDVNSQLASYETVKTYYVYEGHLSVDEGHLTPSLKMRRAKVWEAFQKDLDELYES